MSWLITGTEKNPVDPYRSQVSLLLHGDGANGSTTIVDSSPSLKTVTAAGNAQISTAQSRFGGSSLALDGSGDYLTVPDSSDWDLQGDFTIECWLKALAVGFSAVVATRNSSSVLEPVLYLWNTGVVAWYYNGAVRITGTTNLVGGDFYHVAVCRAAGQTKLFVNGTQEGSTYSEASSYSAEGLWIGSIPFASQNLKGYIDDLRITKGVARYTANFTPPTAPFPDA